MKKIIPLMISVLLLCGCHTTMKVPVDPTPLSKDKSTLIIYCEDDLNGEFEVLVDAKPVTKLTTDNFSKIEIDPGTHDLHANRSVFLINRKITQTFEKGETYYMKIWVDKGMFASSLRIEPAPKIDSYNIRVKK